MVSPVNLVIFAARENISTLTTSLSCALHAIPEGSRVDVLVNGNHELADQISAWICCNTAIEAKQCQVWYISVADKGNAWNQHIHTIWQQDLDAVYIDGYVRISRDAIAALSKTLADNPTALGTSGLPTVGASARTLQQTMRTEGGFHGNLCAIKASALAQLRGRGIRIPLGMYRVDSIMGAFLSFGLDNTVHPWDPFRYLPTTTDARWECDEKKWYRWQDIVAWLNRRKRQIRGAFENAAVKYYLADSKRLPETLPDNVHELVLTWSRSNPNSANALIKQSVRHREAMHFFSDYVPPAPADCIASRISDCQTSLSK